MLKADFVTYLPVVMEILLKDASKSVDMKLVSAKEAELENQDDEEQKTAEGKMPSCTLSIRGVEGPLTIHMNTAALENKISALQIIKSLAAALGPLFFDFVEPVSQLLVTELMHF